MIQGLPAGSLRRAFLAFADEVRNAPALANQRLVKQWLGLDDKPINVAKAVQSLPAVAFRLLAGPVERHASTRAVGGPATSVSTWRPTVVVDLWTGGPDARDAADLGEAIFDALFPQDNRRKEIQARLGAAGIRDWRQTGLILPQSLDDFQPTSTHAVGTFELTMFVGS